MTNKFKTLLKTSAALAILTAGSQTWGSAGVWLNPATGETAATSPSSATVNMILSSGDGTTSAITITPSGSSAGKTFNIGVASQGAAVSNALTIAPTQDCTINLDSASSDVVLLDIANGAHKVTLNLAGGSYSLNSNSGLGTGAVTVKVKDTVSVGLANEALTWGYELTKGKTFTINTAAAITGWVKTNGATIVTPASACTIPTK